MELLLILTNEWYYFFHNIKFHLFQGTFHQFSIQIDQSVKFKMKRRLSEINVFTWIKFSELSLKLNKDERFKIISLCRDIFILVFHHLIDSYCSYQSSGGDLFSDQISFQSGLKIHLLCINHHHPNGLGSWPVLNSSSSILETF